MTTTGSFSAAHLTGLTSALAGGEPARLNVVINWRAEVVAEGRR